MKHHWHLRVLVLGSAVLLLAVVNTFAKDAKTFSLRYASMLGETRVEAGHYKVTWEGQSSEVTVTLASASGKTVVATVRGKLVERSTKYDQNTVVYNTRSDGTQVISELRIGGSNKALVFGE